MCTVTVRYRIRTYLGVKGVPVIFVEGGVQLEPAWHVRVGKISPSIAHQICLLTVNNLIAQHLQQN